VQRRDSVSDARYVPYGDFDASDADANSSRDPDGNRTGHADRDDNAYAGAEPYANRSGDRDCHFNARNGHTDSYDPNA